MQKRKHSLSALKKLTKKSPKATIGWREWAALPELGVRNIKAKVDTGARTSALHAFAVRPFKKNGKDWIHFHVHPLQRNDKLVKVCACPVHDYRWVTNSGGHREQRFVIKTRLRLGEEEWPIEVTLTDRDQMGFRMLAGRTAIVGRMVVDPAKSFCLGRRKKRQGQPTERRIPQRPDIGERRPLKIRGTTPKNARDEEE